MATTKKVTRQDVDRLNEAMHERLDPDAYQEVRDIAVRAARWHDPGALCSACGGAAAEGLTVGNVVLCDRCAMFVHEVKAWRHSGDFPSIVDPSLPAAKAERRKRKPLKPKQRLHLYKRDRFTCRYCGTSGTEAELTLDHIDPTAGNEDENLATACKHCNSSKGARNPDQWGTPLRPVPGTVTT